MINISDWVVITGLVLSVAAAIWHAGSKLGKIQLNTQHMGNGIDDMKKSLDNTNRNIEKLFGIASKHGEKIAKIQAKLEESLGSS